MCAKRFSLEEALEVEKDGVLHLDIANIDIDHLPKSILRYKNLKGLWLKDTNIEELPDWIGQLNNLEYFSLYVRPPHGIPLPKINNMLSRLVELPKLKWLGISADLPRWPQNIFLLANLKKLILSSNNLKEIPDEIGALQKLNGMDVSYNKISHISQSISCLSRLKEVDIRANALREIDNLCSVPSLKKLDLTRNESLEMLPDNIGNLINLKTLELGNLLYWSNIKHIPETFGMLEKLEEINIWKGKLPSLGGYWGKLQNLKKVWISHCNIRQLDFDFSGLKQLETLNLFANRIEELPESICRATGLKELDLARNPIKSLPSQIHGLQNLKELSLHDTKVAGEEINRLRSVLPNTNIMFP